MKSTLCDNTAKNALSGFSLIELLIVLVIASISFAFIFKFSTQNARRLGVENAKSKIDERAQVAMTRLRYDVRYLGFDPAGTITGSFITTNSTTSFHFKGDIDGDNVLESICYQFSGTQLQRAVGDPTCSVYAPVVTNVKSPGSSSLFYYYDINGVVTATSANIRKIGVQITFETEAVDPTKNILQKNTVTVTENFVPRNLLL